MSVSENIENFLEKFKSIQEAFLDYLDDEGNFDDNFQNLKQILEDSKIRDCKHDVRLFLHLLLTISNNRHRCPNFFSKIELILQHFKDDLQKYDNKEIFFIFKSNKRILLFLIEEEILTVDSNFVKQIISEKYLAKKYPQYFAPEINPFLKEEWFPKYDPNDENLKKNEWIEEIKKQLPDDFYEMRKIGENNSYICKLIREDSNEKFITCFHECNIEPNSTIIPSVYETNSFLIKKQIQSKEEITLIEYAAFFGSIKIFNFLLNKRVNLTPSLSLGAIHGKNAKIFDQTVTVTNNFRGDEAYIECVKESIKCHHIEIVDYILNNYLQNYNENSSCTIIQSLKYYNFEFLQKEHINELYFCSICHYDFYSLAKLLASIDVDINRKEIQNHIIQ